MRCSSFLDQQSDEFSEKNPYTKVILMKRTLLSVILVAFMAPVVHADECEDAADDVSMMECIKRAYKASDSKLNQTYRTIEHRLSGDTDGKHLLVQAERNWVAFRDAECSFAASGVAGGSAYPLVHTMCLHSLTKERVDQLKEYLHCEEGDLSCPVPPAD